MSRLHTPSSVDVSPAGSQPLLNAVKAQLGVVPNLFRVIGNSPAALEGYLSLNGALGKGALDARTRKRIALAVAEFNGCSYCLSAHSFLAKNKARLDDTEIAANRDGRSHDAKAEAALRFALKVVEARGHVSDADISDVRLAGYSDAEIVEIVVHVALNTLTNYVNEVARTAIDFPAVAARRAA
jgi:uncharacterized peroxidase-related enzyme